MEQILTAIPKANQPKSFGRRDTYTIICTDKRTIFAKLTNQMLKDAVKEAQQKGKEEGKGFFSRWGSQIQSTMNYHARYWEMSPDNILAETEGNFDISHASLIKLKAKKKVHDDENSYDVKTELKFESPQSKLKFMLDNYSKDTIETLRQVYGNKLQT